MNDTLTIDRILDFYDLPQLLVARDGFDTLYLCLLFNDEPMPLYTAIRVSERRLQAFNNGSIDLRRMFERPEIDGEYFDVSFSDNAYHIEYSPLKRLNEERLPAEGYTAARQTMENVTLSVPLSDTNLLFDIARKFGWACAF